MCKLFSEGDNKRHLRKKKLIILCFYFRFETHVQSGHIVIVQSRTQAGILIFLAQPLAVYNSSDEYINTQHHSVRVVDLANYCFPIVSVMNSVYLHLQRSSMLSQGTV